MACFEGIPMVLSAQRPWKVLTYITCCLWPITPANAHAMLFENSQVELEAKLTNHLDLTCWKIYTTQNYIK